MKKLFVFLVLFLIPKLFAQNNNLEILKKTIDNKVVTTNNYLNVYKLKYLNIKKRFEINRCNNKYNKFIFEPNNYEKDNKLINNKYLVYFILQSDSLTILKIIKNTSISNKNTTSISGPTYDGSKIIHLSNILSFEDLYCLKKESKADSYKKILHLIKNSIENEGFDKTFNLQKQNKFVKKIANISSSHIFLDNSNYLNFMRTTSPHIFPGKKNKLNNYIVDASFSKITFRHKIMYNFLGRSEDNEGLSIEMGSYENFMNVLPWHSLSFTLGARTLFRFGNTNNIEKKDYIEIRTMYKFRLNSHSFGNNFFIFANEPKLNFAKRVALDISFTRPFDLPYLNFYLAYGSNNFTNPFTFTRFDKNKSHYAYFSNLQAKALMSFYWNSGVNDLFRFKLDLGAAYYNIHKVFYKNDYSEVKKDEKQDGWIMPYLAINMNFIPNGNDVLGTNIRLFDSVFKITLWAKLYEFKNDSSIRLEVEHLAYPIGRKVLEWEAKSGTFWQLRYRYRM